MQRGRMQPLEAWRRAGRAAFPALCLVLFIALELQLALRILRATESAGDALVALLALPLAFLAADFASGVVHWACDNFFAEDTPLVGAALIQPFREHHRDPLAITRHSYFERNHANTLAVLPLLAWGALADASPAAGRAEIFADTLLAGFAFAVAITNQLHAWAHAPRVPRSIRLFQRLGVVLPPRHHVRHHQGGQAYCITGGWLDAPLERLKFFERLERVLRRRG